MASVQSRFTAPRGVLAGSGWLHASVTRLVLRLGAVAAAVLATSAVHIPGRPPTVCVLRALTGVPCPFCGGTTAAVHLGHGDLAGALVASPLAVLLLASLSFLDIFPKPAWWGNRRARRAFIVLGLAASELWQLGRYGLLPVHLQ